MEAIYSCKLYRASTRKDKIRAALADPLNAELVTQLRSYLDDEFQDLAVRKKPKVDTSPASSEESNESPTTTDSRGTSARPSHSSSRSSGGSLSDKFDALVGDKPSENLETEPTSTEPDTGSDSEESSSLQEIDESTNIPVSTEPSISLSDIVEEVKGLLNLDETTQGINRALIKDDEMWIYYNDNVNLNTVMGPVIEKINSSGYSYLDFNRLARSENAIVFQINLADTNKSISTEGDLNE